MPHASVREVATILSALSRSTVTPAEVEAEAVNLKDTVKLGTTIWVHRRDIHPLGKRLGLDMPRSEIRHE